MDDQTEVIRHQMEGTRMALAEKLELLEAQVTEKVQQATSAVTETVDNVSDVVGDVKETVEETVDAVKHTFDLQWHAQHHPWMVLGGAVVLGFVGGSLLRPSRPRERHEKPARASFIPSPQPEPPPPPKPAHHEARSSEGKSSEWSQVWGWLGKEAEDLKKLGIGVALGVLREVVVNTLPSQLGPMLSEGLNTLTQKLGGMPLGKSEPDQASNDHPQPQNQELQGGPFCQPSC
jgi:ElaB/YqjD/DUF883 family membrane-anchored ribosome-binding protein